MRYNKNNTKLLIVLVLLGILILALYKGCVVYKKTGKEMVDYKSRIETLEKDSAETASLLKANSDSLEFINGQLGVHENREAAFNDSFRVLNNRITALRKVHKPISPSVDTNVTTVPNEYINECEGCYDALASAQDKGLKYKAELDNKDQVYLSKLNTLNRRIKILETQNSKLSKDYRGALDSMPSGLKRTLFFTVSAMSVSSVLPNAIGAGFMYEDKRRRIYGAKYYVSNVGPIYSAELSFPLSLRFIK